MRIHRHFVIAQLSHCISFHTLKLVYTHRFLLDLIHMSMHLDMPPACSPVPHNLTIPYNCLFLYDILISMMLLSNHVSLTNLISMPHFVPKSFIKLLPEPSCAELHLSPSPSPCLILSLSTLPTAVFILSYLFYKFPFFYQLSLNVSGNTVSHSLKS